MKRSKAVDTAPNEDIYVDATAFASVARRLPRDVILLAILILASTGSFGLGVVAGRESGQGNREGESGGKILIEKPAAAETAPAAAGEAVDPATEAVGSVKTKSAPAPASGGQYVASKSGTKYYLPWCGTAKRIKDGNKVWFASKAEAEAAGYEPAKNCKGL